MVFFLCRMCICLLQAALWSHIGTLMRLLAAEPRSIAGPLFACQYLSRTILVTPYSMVWDWRVSRAGPMSLYWPSCSLPFCLLLFFIFILSFYGFLLWAWGLRTDRVLIALSQPYITNLFLIMIIITSCSLTWVNATSVASCIDVLFRLVGKRYHCSLLQGRPIPFGG